MKVRNILGLSALFVAAAFAVEPVLKHGQEGLANVVTDAIFGHLDEAAKPAQPAPVTPSR